MITTTTRKTEQPAREFSSFENSAVRHSWIEERRRLNARIKRQQRRAAIIYLVLCAAVSVLIAMLINNH